MSSTGPGLEAARRYESWYETPFGMRADALERRLLAAHLAALGSPGRLLEVGCGTGHFADLWVGAGYEAVGIDLAPDGLRYSLMCRPAFPVVRGNALALPFRDGCFDVVAMVTSLEFIEPPLAALEEAARVARRGMVIVALNSWSPVAWWRRWRARWGKGRRPSSYAGAGFLSPRVLARAAGRLGAGSTAVRWQTALYPVSWLDGLTALPFGAFVVMSVRLDRDGA